MTVQPKNTLNSKPETLHLEPLKLSCAISEKPTPCIRGQATEVSLSLDSITYTAAISACERATKNHSARTALKTMGEEDAPAHVYLAIFPTLNRGL